MISRYLINAANLRRGGGVAVAASVIHQISLDAEACQSIHLLLSTEVAANLISLGTNLSNFSNVTYCKNYRARTAFAKSFARPPRAAVVFTIFGPYYGLKGSSRHIVGFAQPWIIYPKNSSSRGLSITGRLRQRAKYLIQAAFFGRADLLVVEAAHVKSRLRGTPFLRHTRVVVVANTVDEIFFDRARWEQVDLPDSSRIRLGIVSANYPHKNLACIPAVAAQLRARYGLDVEFITTLTESEFKSCTKAFRDAVTNVGPIALSQCPSFYSQLDGVFFPSLLECFSATPIEALVMDRPLFASDREFVREFVGDYANYFDPLDIDSIVDSIGVFFSEFVQRSAVPAPVGSSVDSIGGAATRATAYLRLIHELDEWKD